MSSSAAEYLSGRWRFLLNRFVKRIWFRALLYSVAAVVVALIGALAAPYMAFPFELELAAEAVDNILAILASSMLAVTIFSLSIMVNAYAAAATNSTPRATALLIGDSVASNTLSTFIGSFLFSIVGIVGLSAGIYGEKGRIFLFASTLVVLFLVTVALLRWIEQLTRFGRVSDTIRRVEKAAATTARSWGRTPRLGARCANDVPEDAPRLYLKKSGYVQHIDVEALNRHAKASGGSVHILRMPGHFVSHNVPVAVMEVEPEGDGRSEMAEAFTVAAERTFSQDPHYGLIVLSEIASRALSPAVNDPGTAIQVLSSGVRVIEAYCEGYAEREENLHQWVYAPDIAYPEMLEDFINPIARDGAGLLEVQTRLQATLHMIALANRDLFGVPAKRLSAVALKRALAKMDSKLEEARLRRRADWELPDPVSGEGEEIPA